MSESALSAQAPVVAPVETPLPGQSSILPTRPQRVLVLGGTSEIGLAVVEALGLAPHSEVLLAGRDAGRLATAAKTLAASVPAIRISTVRFDAVQTDGHQALIDAIFAEGSVDIVLSAAGVLVPQDVLDRNVHVAAEMIETNFTGHVTTMLAAASHMRAQGHGTIVVLSSVAAVRPRKANPVYGATKAGLDAFARGLADALHGTGVRVLLVRPGFVIGRMTEGMDPAPLATTPAAVGAATAAALRGKKRTVWVPGKLAVLATALKCVPRPIWRRISRLTSPRPLRPPSADAPRPLRPASANAPRSARPARRPRSTLPHASAPARRKANVVHVRPFTRSPKGNVDHSCPSKGHCGPHSPFGLGRLCAIHNRPEWTTSH
jgi:decaprenylphospho-beta-D-erythro-pentofuranosid-2-ulose 2-reductase